MNFDLNIENYSPQELIEMFDLPANYDSNILNSKESKLRENIINNREIDNVTQQKTLNFLVEAKKIILNKKDEKNNSVNLLERAYNTNFSLKPTELESTSEHMVQVRADSPYILSKPSEYAPGVINPLKRKVTIKNLNIDSRFRDNYYGSAASNFNVNLPIMFTHVATMTLNAIELPTSYYSVSKQYGNNFFNVIVNGVIGVVNLPEGNYSQKGIMECINTELKTLVDLEPDFANVVFAINLGNDITGKVTGSGQTIAGFNGNQPPSSTLELNFQLDRKGIDDRNTPLPLKLGWLLGFRNGVYTNNVNYVSEGLVDVSGPKYVYLVVDDYNTSVNNNFYSAFNSSLLNKNILARISVQTNQFNPFNLLEQNNLANITTPREYFGPVNIQALTIQLLDEYGRILQMNNMDFSFCLTLTTIYDL
jgi:hypothetical protein